jgi:hypothetical protein
MANEYRDISSNKPDQLAAQGSTSQASNHRQESVLVHSITQPDENSLEENLKHTLTQSAISKPCGESLDAEREPSQHALESEKSAEARLRRAADWWRFWAIVWMGTTLAGSFFGGGLGFIACAASGSAEGLLLPFLGIFVGALWAGSVGLPVIATFAFIVWCFWLQKKPGILAACAGALTGFVSAPFACFLTSPLGAVGAYWAVKRLSRVLRDDYDCHQSQRPTFSIQDLFWRMTGFAVILTMWMTVIRWFWPSL